MTAAHWMAVVGWGMAGLLFFALRAAVEDIQEDVAWRKCAEDAIAGLRMLEGYRCADRVRIRRSEWACLALLARQHREAKHDGEDFRTCARCREVAAEVGAGKA